MIVISIPFSEPLGMQKCVGEVDQKADRHDAAEHIVDEHVFSPLETIADDGVANGDDKERQTKSQQQEIKHRVSLFKKWNEAHLVSQVSNASGELALDRASNCIGRYKLSRGCGDLRYKEPIKRDRSAKEARLRAVSMATPFYPEKL
jgi:hypothetical protein